MLQVHDPSLPRVSVILSCDVAGSADALLNVLSTYQSNDKCVLDVIDVSVGVVSDEYIAVAKEFNGCFVIYKFIFHVPFYSNYLHIQSSTNADIIGKMCRIKCTDSFVQCHLPSDK